MRKSGFAGALAVLLAVLVYSLSGVGVAQKVSFSAITTLREEPSIKFSQKVQREESLGCNMTLQMKAGLISGTCYVVDYKTYKNFLKKLYSSLEERGWSPGMFNESLGMSLLAQFFKGSVSMEFTLVGNSRDASKFAFVVTTVRR